MTLLLICYMCGQSEKVRLSMWLLIISAATYIFAFWWTSVYAMETEPNEYWLYNTWFEDVQETPVQQVEPTPLVEGDIVHTANTTPQNTVRSTTPWTQIVRHNRSNASKKNTWNKVNHSVLTEELWYLIELQGSFSWGNVFEWNNVVFYQLLKNLLEKKSVDSHEMYIEKTLELISLLNTNQLKKYDLDRVGLVSALTAIKITSEKVWNNLNWSNNWNMADWTLGSYYTVQTITPELVRLDLTDNKQVKRISFYVNDKFVTGCESTQCSSLLIEASSWDVVSAHITIQNHMSTVLSGRM